MKQVNFALLGLIAIIHAGFLIVETCFWTNPAVYGRLSFSNEQAIKAAPIVANTGLYNGFLAAGLTWSLIRPDDKALRTFFLTCVFVAGVFGFVTLQSRGPLVLQSLPATVAFALMHFARPKAVHTPAIQAPSAR
jgi:putative membrane protein